MSTSPVLTEATLCKSPNLVFLPPLTLSSSNLLDTVGTLLGNVLLGPCQSGCASAGYDYSVWSPSLSVLGINLLNMCYCANKSSWTLNGNLVKPAEEGTTTCAKGGLIGLGLLKPDWTVTWHKPGTWQHSTCLSGATLAGGPTTGVTDINQCFAACQPYKYAAFTYTGSSTIGCTCGTVLTGGTTVACGSTGTWSNSAARRGLQTRGLGGGAATIYVNSAPEISVVARRKREIEAELRAEAERRDNAYCPSGLTGCAIPGSKYYECINTDAELESCGGCTNGVYGNSNSTAALGVDCTSLRGVAVGGVSCVSGKCQVASCRQNWELKNGECVRVAPRK